MRITGHGVLHFLLRYLQNFCAFALMFTLTGFAQAGTYYTLDMEGASISGGRLNEDGHRFRLRTEGGGTTPKLTTGLLVLHTDASPPGATRDRAELQITSAIEFDRMWFLGMRVMQPFEDPIAPGQWHLFMQCPQWGATTPPPLSLNMEPGGLFSLVARSDVDRYERLWVGPMPVGRWLDLVIGFRMGERGHVRLWVNGTKVADVRTVLRWKAGQDRCTLKTGVYRAPGNAPFEMWFDDIRLGDTYNDVAP